MEQEGHVRPPRGTTGQEPVISADLLRLLRCPRTGSPLRLVDPETLRAEQGAHSYAIVAGIPDLRLDDPPYVTREEERERVAGILTAAGSMSYERLVVHYESEILKHQSARDRQKHIDHRLALRSRAKRRFEQLVNQVGYREHTGHHEWVLDLGTGSGEALSALARHTGARVVGIDISLEELVLARSLLLEEGQEAMLVAGGAEALPFADASFGFVYSPDVIEHVRDQERYLRQANRVLAPGGYVLFNSPNRYSLVNPEPHNGVWAFGFLPRASMDRVSRLLGRGSYVGKRLVSLPELRRLSAANFPQHSIHCRRSNPRATSLSGRLFHGTSPYSERAYAYIADMHVVLGRKN